jgi:hypothetical protein
MFAPLLVTKEEEEKCLPMALDLKEKQDNSYGYDLETKLHSSKWKFHSVPGEKGTIM